MKQNETLEKIQECKKLIKYLADVQDKLFADLENALQLDDANLNDYVFDYVYNSDNKSFKEYLSIYGPKYAQAYEQ